MRKSYFLLTLLLSLFFISCNFAADESLSLTVSETNRLTIYVNSSDSAISFSSQNARTITPSSLTNEDLDFYLTGTNTETATTLDTQKLTFTPNLEDSSTGIISLDLARGIYSLKLIAVKKGAAFSLDYYYLQGSAYVDLRYDTEVHFNLTSSAINRSGYAELYLYTLGWQAGDSMSVKVGMYDSKDTLLSETTSFGLKDYHYDSASQVPQSPTYNYNAEHYPFSAGTYTLKVTITSANIDYFFTEKVLIEPNRTTTGSLAIPNIVSSVPEGPTYLIARYAAPETTSQIQYTTQFCWDDNSNNEDTFQLELLCVDDVESTYNTQIEKLLSTSETVSTKNSLWETVKSAVVSADENNSIILNNEYYEDSEVAANLEGSLKASNTFCMYNLMLGQKYVARICAVSTAGSSDYAYLDISNSNSRTFDTPQKSYTFHNWTSNAKAINLYRIKYELNSGLFYDDSTGSNVTSYVQSCYYYFQNGETKAILQPVNYVYTGGSTATLRINSASGTSFVQWRLEQQKGDVCSYSAYSGYNNLTLFADFGVDTENIYIFVPQKNLFAYQSNDSDILNSMASENTIAMSEYNSFSVSKTAYRYLYVALKNMFADSSLNTAVDTGIITRKVFSNIRITVSEQGDSAFLSDAATTEECINAVYTDFYALDLQDTTTFQTGKTYNVVLKANANGQEYSTTLIFTVTE